MAERDGWQAFPVPQDAWQTEYAGMTLRDYFAGQALQAGYWAWDDLGNDHGKIAQWCYGMADAMLEARKRG